MTPNKKYTGYPCAFCSMYVKRCMAALIQQGYGERGGKEVGAGLGRGLGAIYSIIYLLPFCAAQLNDDYCIVCPYMCIHASVHP